MARNFATGESSLVGRQELDVGVGHLEQRLLDPVGLDRLAVGDRGAEDLGVPGDRGVEVVDGDGHVVDLGEQRGRSLMRRASGRG